MCTGSRCVNQDTGWTSLYSPLLQYMSQWGATSERLNLYMVNSNVLTWSTAPCELHNALLQGGVRQISHLWRSAAGQGDVVPWPTFTSPRNSHPAPFIIYRRGINHRDAHLSSPLSRSQNQPRGRRRINRFWHRRNIEKCGIGYLVLLLRQQKLCSMLGNNLSLTVTWKFY